MSMLSTPTRLGRGLVVPGIDTKSPLDKSNSVLSYGGLQTPPQSAHESRRPSLKYAGSSEAPFSAASYTHSQPVTPIHGLNSAVDFFSQRWPQSFDAQEPTSASVAEACSTSPTGDRSFQSAFGADASFHNSMIGDAQGYSHLDHGNSIETLGLQSNSCSPTDDSWRQSQTIPTAYAAHNACLGSTLFPIPHGMNVSSNHQASVFDHVGQSIHHFNYQSAPETAICTTQAYGNPASVFQSPQVVVPSQLSPEEDYSDQHMPTYTTPTRSHDDLPSGFSSEPLSFNGWEMVRPPSPQDVYFAHSEDEDYLMVKSQDVSSPMVGVSSRKYGEMPIRSRRRASRRPRKASNRTTHCQHDFNGCVIQCQGRQCCLRLQQPVKFEASSKQKQYQCKFIDEDGRSCNAGFDRSEHLKRHEGKHSSERKYFCPLPECNRRIGRPDNAGDHFKTHLRPKKPGKRNAHFSWHVVQSEIWDNYDDKKVAKKLLDGLSRWIDSGMPDTSTVKAKARSRQIDG